MGIPAKEFGLRGATRAISAFVYTVAIAMWPAFWNGAPGVFTDTVEYVELGQWLAWGYVRPASYGFLIRPLHGGWSLWPIAIAQATLLVLLVRLACRVTGCLRTYPALVILLAATTSFSWTAIFLTPDLFAPAAILAAWLLAAGWHDLSRAERIGLGIVVFIACACHLSVIPLTAGLILLLGFLRLWDSRTGLAWKGLGVVGLGLGAACLGLAGMGLWVYGSPGFVYGGPVFYLARLVGDGLAQRFLAEHCAADAWRLCAWRMLLPDDSDLFLWSPQSPLLPLGRFLGMRDEAQTLNAAILRAYPAEILWNGIVASVAQFVTMRPGDGMDQGAVELWSIYAAPFLDPGVTRALRVSRQASMHVQDWWATLIPVPVMLAACAGCAWMLAMRRSRLPARVATLLLAVLAGAAGNAVIIGFLSAVHDRYQARVAWLWPLALMLALLTVRRAPETQ